MAKVAKTPAKILPSGRYRPAVAARMMGIARCTLYKYLGENRIKSEFVNEKGVQRQVIKGIEIIKFNENAIYTC